MGLFHRAKNKQASAPASGAPKAVDPARVEASRAAGHQDAEGVARGERVVRAILAHHAEPTFLAMCPDLDLDEYLIGYRSVPDSKPPMDRRQGDRAAPDHPRRRWDDYYT